MTLEELKALSPDELYHRWNWEQFPFDPMRQCHRCLTQHMTELECSQYSEHKFLKAVVPKVAFWRRLIKADYKQVTPRWLVAHLDELYALRLFFKDLYPSTPEVEQPEEVSRDFART